MIAISLYRAMLDQSRFDVDIQDVDAYRYKIYDLLILILDNNELFLKNNDKAMCLLHLLIPSTSYLYYDRYTNYKYAKTKRIPKRLR